MIVTAVFAHSENSVRSPSVRAADEIAPIG